MERLPVFLARTEWFRWLGMVVLVTVESGRWFLNERFPGARSTVGSAFVGCAGAAVVLLLVVLFGSRQELFVPGRRPRARLGLFVAGSMLLCGPAIALFFRGGEVSGTGVAIAMSLTPVVVGIAGSSLGSGASGGVGGKVWQGLAAFAGLLMLVVQPSLGDVGADVAYVLAPVLTGCGAVLFFLNWDGSIGGVVLALCGGGTGFAVVLAKGGLRSGVFGGISFASGFADGSVALLAVGVLTQAGPRRWSSQFALVPLLIAIQGIVMLHEPMTLRAAAGLLLLGISSAALLRRDEDQDSQVLGMG